MYFIENNVTWLISLEKPFKELQLLMKKEIEKTRICLFTIKKGALNANAPFLYLNFIFLLKIRIR